MKYIVIRENMRFSVKIAGGKLNSSIAPLVITTNPLL